jgi:hypothetical protein
MIFARAHCALFHSANKDICDQDCDVDPRRSWKQNQRAAGGEVESLLPYDCTSERLIAEALAGTAQSLLEIKEHLTWNKS